MFGWFGKKDKDKGPHYDPTNIKIQDLRRGFLVDYDMKTWLVVEEYEYDWGDNYFTYEYKLECENDALFLSIEGDDELELTLSRKINWALIDGEVESSILDKGKPPKKVVIDGITFYRGNEKPGFFRDIHTTAQGNSEEFLSWEYSDEEEKLFLTIEQWEDTEFEASIGQDVPERVFSNILPSNSDN